MAEFCEDFFWFQKQNRGQVNGYNPCVIQMPVLLHIVLYVQSEAYKICSMFHEGV